MAVRIKFLSVVVPIDKINASSIPGGLQGILASNPQIAGKAFWHDDLLFVEFAMNPMDTQALVQQWESHGLVARVEANGARQWKDVCVVDYYEGPTLPCGWLEFDPNTKVAWKKGESPGEITGPATEGDPLFMTPKQFQHAQEYAVPAECQGIKPWWKFW
jgi:hypothetical protein